MTISNTAGLAAPVAIPVYDSPRRPSVLWPVIVAISQGVVWSSILGFLLLIEPAYVRILMDFKADLPSFTINVIRFADFVGDWWFLIPIPLAAWMVVNGYIVWRLDVRESIIGKIAWYSLTWGAAIITLAAINLAFAVPLVHLVNALTGRKS